MIILKISYLNKVSLKPSPLFLSGDDPFLLPDDDEDKSDLGPDDFILPNGTECPFAFRLFTFADFECW